MKLGLSIRLAQTCAVCDEVLPDAQERDEAMTLIALFGLANGWRVCPCWRYVWRGQRKATRRYVSILNGAHDWRAIRLSRSRSKHKAS